MNVLIACEFSGIVREAFAKRGHNAWSCDLLPTEILGQHIQKDILTIPVFRQNSCDLEIADQRPEWGWDLLIAHPPCTYLSNAGARFLYPKGVLNKDRLKLGMEAKEFFMKLLNANIVKICVENPVPSKIFGLPNYNQTIQPYEFGHPFQKRTCLWLKNLEPLKPTNIVEKPQSTKIAGNWFNKGGKDRQKNRSRTFQGIADAMVAQWG